MKRAQDPGPVPPDLSTPTLMGVTPGDTSGLRAKQSVQKETETLVKRLELLQNMLWAENRRAVLVILQGMDASGKDGAVRGVFSGVSPLGLKVYSFKAPCAEELDHDFLWRIHPHCPPRGEIAVFNRSHYEDVLIARVKQLAPPDELDRRYRQINEFERMLGENGTTVVKFMLHISYEEQRERLQARLDDPLKGWKFEPGDLAERKLWPQYMAAYARMLKECDTPHAPWRVVAADHKWHRDWFIAKELVAVMEGMKPKVPAKDSRLAGVKVE
ncbi:hypothetical protein BH11PLA1_BH11PLA1_19140 [soil metagenome]